MLPDSTEARTYSLEGVVITASRVPETESYSPSFVTVLSHQDIEASNGVSLADVLAPSTGIFIKDYGSASAVKTISQRGLGSEHTLVLLNGLRVSSMQNGLMDLGLMPTDEIESIEILRGGQSALYGADAVAGLINIVTRPEAVHNGIDATASLGSFGYRSYHVTGSLSSGSDVVRLGYGEERSKEDFPFIFHNGPIVSNLTRKNSDVVARYGTVYGEIGLDQTMRLALLASGMTSERGIGGAVVSQFSAGSARQIDRDQLVQASLSSFLSEHASFHCSAQLHLAYERYRDPGLNINGLGLDNYFQDKDARIEPRMDMALGDRIKLGVGSEWVSASASGNSVSQDVSRKQFGTYLASQVNVMKSTGIIDDASVFPALRFDAISSMSPVWSPQFGGVIRFESFDAWVFRRVITSLKFNTSRNFRMPTFNELYFSGGGGFGNPDLRPEFSTSMDGGGSVNFLLAGEHVAQVSYFLNDMTDRIVWVAVPGGAVSPKNLRRVRSLGIESSYRWDLPGRILSLEANYSGSDASKVSADYPGDPTTDKQLIYVPRRTATVAVRTFFGFNTAVLRECDAALSYSFVGSRYTTEDNADSLPSYWVANASVRSRVGWGTLTLSIRLEVNNLFDEDYQVILSYPMPRRSFRLTVGLDY